MKLITLALNQTQFLAAPLTAHRDHQPSTVSQLLQQSWRYMLGRGSGNNGVKRAVLIPAETAVIVTKAHIANIEQAQIPFSLFHQRTNPLHRPYLLGQA